MKTSALSAAIVSAATLAISGSLSAQAATLGFDDLPNKTFIPNGYGGLDWNNFGVVTPTVEHPNGSGYGNGTVSPSNVALNSSGTLAAVLSQTAFDFNSVYLTAAWNNALTVQIDGYWDGVLRHREIIQVDATAPTLFNFTNFRTINQLTLFSSGGTNAGLDGTGTQFAMDNFTYSAVPDPATIGGSLAAMGLAVRIMKKRPKIPHSG
jgi:hypothetical protein